MNPKAVSGFTKEDAASVVVVSSFIIRQLLAFTQRYREYIAPPASPTVFPIKCLKFAPASSTTPPPSLPTFIGFPNLGFICFIRPSWIFIFATVALPDPLTLTVSRSAAKLISKPKSDGLIGHASTFIRTSSSDGFGLSDLTIDISIVPSLVTVDLISLENSSLIFFLQNIVIIAYKHQLLLD